MTNLLLLLYQQVIVDIFSAQYLDTKILSTVTLRKKIKFSFSPFCTGKQALAPQNQPIEARQTPPQQHPSGAGAPPPPQSINLEQPPPVRPVQPHPAPPRASRPRPRPRPGPQRRPGPGILCAAKSFASEIRLKDEAFMKKQLDCVLDKGPCDKTGNLIKRTFR